MKKETSTKTNMTPGTLAYSLSEAGRIRIFTSGASRDIDTTKHDPEGFLSPLVIRRYCEYMHHHRKMTDGSLRDSDNWQKGMPLSVYMKSLWRHTLDVWTLTRGFGPVSDNRGPVYMEDALCAIMFNAQGMLLELLKAKRGAK